jgi:C1A family cysteine protease
MTARAHSLTGGPGHLTLAEYRSVRSRAERRRKVARVKNAPRRLARAVTAALRRMAGLPSVQAADAPLPDALDPRDGANNRLATAVRKQPDGDPRCVAYAVAGAMEAWWCRREGAADAAPFLSVTQIFKNSGASKLPEKAARAVSSGIVDERCEPPDHLGPCTHARIHSWVGRVDFMTESPKHLRDPMRRELVNGNPLLITIPIFENFASFSGPGPYKPSGAEIGAHALSVVGYRRDGATGFWIVRNSYGTGWGGDGGYGLIEWGDSKLDPEFDVWAVKQVQNPAP